MRISTFLAVSLLLFLLSACTCGDRICDCFSEGEDIIAFSFATDSLQTGFRKAEIRSAYVVRYQAPGFAAPLDTVRQRPGQFPDFYRYGYASVELNYLFQARPNQPAAPLTAYNYRIVLPAANQQYDVSELELAGETTGDRCCKCYRNTRKRLRLNGAYIQAEDLNGPAATLRR